MQIFPSYQSTIHTHLSPDEVHQRLSKETSSKPFRWFFLKEPEFKFNGKIEQTAFSIRRNITYRNSFIPIVRGQIVETQSGTDVKLELRLYLYKFILALYIYWYGFTFFAASLVLGSGGPIGLLLMLAVFAAIPPPLTWIAFNYERNITIQTIQEILDSSREKKSI